MCSILSLVIVARCLETLDICIWRLFYVCCSECVGVCGNVCCVAAVVENRVLNLGVLKHVVCLCRGCLLLLVRLITRISQPAEEDNCPL